MFLFRKNAEPADDAGDHEPVDVTNAHHEEEEPEEVDDYEHDDAEAHPAYGNDEEQYEDQDQEEEEAEQPAEDEPQEVEDEEPAAVETPRGDSEDAPHASREGTVPPLEEHHLLQLHQQEAEAEAAAAAAAANATAAASHPAAVPGLAMPRTYATGTTSATAPAAATTTPPSATHPHGGNVRRSSRGTTPRTTAGLSPRSHSRGGGGASYTGSARSAEEAEAVEQQYRRCSSVVQSARNISDRRASSVNHLVGDIDGGAGAVRRRSGSMTTAEREAVEKMMENEFRRQEAVERAAQFGRIRETSLVEAELAKEKASYDLLKQHEKAVNAEMNRRGSLREERTATAAQRRRELEEQLQRAVLESVSAKEARYTARDPYTVVAAQRRYRSPITPSRRVSVPAGQPDSRRASAGAGGSRTHSANADYRRNSAPAPAMRHVKPGIDMSPPKQCLPMDAWKTPEQQAKKNHSGNYADRCLPPGAWQAPTVVDHPRQWH